MVEYKYYAHDDDGRILDKEFDNFADAFDYCQDGLITFIWEVKYVDGVESEEDEEIVWSWDSTWDKDEAIAEIAARHAAEQEYTVDESCGKLCEEGEQPTHPLTLAEVKEKAVIGECVDWEPDKYSHRKNDFVVSCEVYLKDDHSDDKTVLAITSADTREIDLSSLDDYSYEPADYEDGYKVNSAHIEGAHLDGWGSEFEYFTDLNYNELSEEEVMKLFNIDREGLNYIIDVACDIGGQEFTDYINDELHDPWSSLRDRLDDEARDRDSWYEESLADKEPCEDCDEDFEVTLKANAEDIADLSRAMFGDQFDQDFGDPVEDHDPAELKNLMQAKHKLAHNHHNHEVSEDDLEVKECLTEGFTYEETQRFAKACEALGIITMGEVAEYSKAHGNIKNQALLAALEADVKKLQDSENEDISDEELAEKLAAARCKK